MVRVEVHIYSDNLSFITISGYFISPYNQSVKSGLKPYKKLIYKILDFCALNCFYRAQVFLIDTSVWPKIHGNVSASSVLS